MRMAWSAGDATQVWLPSFMLTDRPVHAHHHRLSQILLFAMLQIEAYGMDSCWAEKAGAFDRTPCRNTATTSATKVDSKKEYDPHVGRCKACSGLHRPGECPVGIDH